MESHTELHKTTSDELLAETQAGFRSCRSTIEQIFKSRILIEKHRQHQRNLYQTALTSKKHLTVWHQWLWYGKWTDKESLVQVTEVPLNSLKSAVLLNNQIRTDFRTTVGVCQGCSLSPVLFNILLENIMIGILQDHHYNFRWWKAYLQPFFADNIEGTKKELKDLTDIQIV